MTIAEDVPLVTKTTPLVYIPPAEAPTFGKKLPPPIVIPKKSKCDYYYYLKNGKRLGAAYADPNQAFLTPAGFELPEPAPPLAISSAGLGKHG